MSTTRGVLAQSPEPEAHNKVLDNNPDRIGNRGYYMAARGYEFYLRVFNSISS